MRTVLFPKRQELKRPSDTLIRSGLWAMISLKPRRACGALGRLILVGTGKEDRMKQRPTMGKSQTWSVCLAALALACCCTSLCVGQETKSDELKLRIRAIETELKRLREGEGAPLAYKEYRNLVKQWNEMHQRHRKEQQNHQERMRELGQQQGLKDWQQRKRGWRHSRQLLTVLIRSTHWTTRSTVASGRCSAIWMVTGQRLLRQF